MGEAGRASTTTTTPTPTPTPATARSTTARSTAATPTTTTPATARSTPATPTTATPATAGSTPARSTTTTPATARSTPARSTPATPATARSTTGAGRPTGAGAVTGGSAAPAAAPAPPDPSTRAEDVVFRPIRTGNVFEEAVERILHAIKLGVVTAGERLPPERKLAARLGVSRVTVREALRVLEQAGYVESRRGRTGGTFVTYRATVDPADRTRDAHRVARLRRTRGADLDDALTLRAVLDVGAAEIAAGRSHDGRMDDAERRHLRERLEDCEQAGAAEHRQMDSRLHLAIAEVTGAPSVAAHVADVRMRVNDLLDEIPLLAPSIEHSSQQHRAVVDAILAGDVAGARKAMEEHLDGTAALLRGFLA